MELDGREFLKPNNSILSISYKSTDALRDMIISPMQRANLMDEVVKNFKVILPKCVAKPVELIPSQVYCKFQKDRALENFMH